VTVDLWYSALAAGEETPPAPGPVGGFPTLAFVARHLAQESADPASPFAGRIGPLVAGGNSMGGGASVLAASLEPTFAGLLALAAAETSPSAAAAAPLVEALHFSSQAATIASLPRPSTAAPSSRRWAPAAGIWWSGRAPATASSPPGAAIWRRTRRPGATVRSHCPEPPALEMGWVTIQTWQESLLLTWPLARGATTYRLAGASPAAWPLFMP
jgi:hypothetical protein